MKQQSILIVDDNPLMRRALKALLSDLAPVCYECGDGNAALAAYRQHRPDWVLMDLKLAGTDGLAVTALLRAADPSARVLIVTTYDDPALREAALEAGACGFVLKENLSKLRSLLESASGAP